METQTPAVQTAQQKPRFDWKSIDFSWKTGRDYLLILIGAFIQALAMRLFLIPSDLVSGGISGAAQLINSFTRFPIGLMVLIGNAPLVVLGWRYLGGPRFVLRTALAVVTFSLFTDGLVYFLPVQGLTQDVVLNSLYGGVLLGIGLGVVYRGRGTSGGSDILARVLNHRFHLPISQAYLIGDGLVVLAAGFTFGWVKALYALVMIYVCGLAAEAASEGTDVFREAMIVSTRAQEIADRVLEDLERGATILPGTGAYTGEARPVLICVVSRAEVHQLKSLVREIDPGAFMVIGIAHEALGEGFKPLK